MSEEELIINVLEGRIYKIIDGKTNRDVEGCVWLTFQEAQEMPSSPFDVDGVYGLRKWANGNWHRAKWSDGQIYTMNRKKVVK